MLEVFAASVDTLIPTPLQKLRTLYLPRTPRQERNEEQNTRSNISRHYDLSNELFSNFLDTTMSYSSALFPADARTPWTPCRGKPWRRPSRRRSTGCWTRPASADGTRLLEIGTGWGELALRAAARGATVYSVTLSSEQQALAQERIAAAGYADQVTVALQDYRAVEGEFDAVVSVEMIEAVGYEYWPIYFQTIDRVLAPGGKVAIQAITMPHGRMLATRNAYTWVHKYIFPGGFLPSVRAIEGVTQQHTTLRVRERMGMGDHYAATLRLWEERFMARSPGGGRAGLRRGVPADVAVLPLLLAGRFPVGLPGRAADCAGPPGGAALVSGNHADPAQMSVGLVTLRGSEDHFGAPFVCAGHNM